MIRYMQQGVSGKASDKMLPRLVSFLWIQSSGSSSRVRCCSGSYQYIMNPSNILSDHFRAIFGSIIARPAYYFDDFPAVLGYLIESLSLVSGNQPYPSSIRRRELFSSRTDSQVPDQTQENDFLKKFLFQVHFLKLQRLRGVRFTRLQLCVVEHVRKPHVAISPSLSLASSQFYCNTHTFCPCHLRSRFQRRQRGRQAISKFACSARSRAVDER